MLGLLKTVLVGDALELVTLLDKASILKLDVALLLHDLGDLLRLHLGHLIAHIVLQLLEVLQFLDHLFTFKRKRN